MSSVPDLDPGFSTPPMDRIDAERMQANLASAPAEEELRAAGRLVDRALAVWDDREPS